VAKTVKGRTKRRKMILKVSSGLEFYKNELCFLMFNFNIGKEVIWAQLDF